MTEPYQPYPPDQPPQGQPPPVPLPVPPPGFMIGTASGVQSRLESSSQNRLGMTVLSFRLHASDRDQPVEVEMRALSLFGTVRDGDLVSVPSTIGRSGRIEPTEVQNLTTKTLVKVSRPSKAGRVVVIVILLLLLVFFVLFIAAIMVGMSSSG